MKHGTLLAVVCLTFVLAGCTMPEYAYYMTDRDRDVMERQTMEEFALLDEIALLERMALLELEEMTLLIEHLQFRVEQLEREIRGTTGREEGDVEDENQTPGSGHRPRPDGLGSKMTISGDECIIAYSGAVRGAKAFLQSETAPPPPDRDAQKLLEEVLLITVKQDVKTGETVLVYVSGSNRIEKRWSGCVFRGASDWYSAEGG